jgi:hypothetical protein
MSHPSHAPTPRFDRLPASFPAEGAVHVELVDGVPMFRASAAVQRRIEHLLDLQRDAALTDADREELDCYEALDDHFSLLNRLTRNQLGG